MSSELVNTLKLQAELDAVKKELAECKKATTQQQTNPKAESVFVYFHGREHTVTIVGDIRTLEKLQRPVAGETIPTISELSEGCWGKSIVFKNITHATTTLLKHGFKYIVNQDAFNGNGNQNLAITVWGKNILKNLKF
jgi:hypothetical protein